jgi:uncharacterized membrane protein
VVRRTRLHHFVDKERIAEAIAAAQHLTSAPIGVSIAPYFWGNVRRTAERAFRKHGLQNTPHRNGVLFFIVPSRREFAIIGDAGAHEAVGQPVWDSSAQIVQEHFARGDTTAGLLRAIDSIAHALAEKFPGAGT